MDLRFTPEENAFREEVRTFLKGALPEPIRKKMVEGRSLSKDDIVTWQRILNKKGWAVPHWPKEWGGTGWTPVQQYIFQEERRCSRRPSRCRSASTWSGPVHHRLRHRRAEEAVSAAHRQSRRLVVPGLLRAGRRLRPRLAQDHGRARRRPLHRQRPEDLDHARAIRRLDLLPGAHRPRREEAGRHLVPADRHEDARASRCARSRPSTAASEVNEVFFDDVKVPVENLVGEENKGWDYAKFLLGNERTGIARVGVSKERIRRIKELAAHRALRRQAADRGPRASARRSRRSRSS